jgi:nucleoside-diphosphate-sugar epimerase
MNLAYIFSAVQSGMHHVITYLREERGFSIAESPWPRFSREILLRVIADAIIINLSLITAVVLRLYLLIAVENTDTAASVIVHQYEKAYILSFWQITLICLVLFYTHGFYTYGRAYCGRFKAFIVIEATSLSFLIYSAITLFTADVFQMPRGVIVFAWGITLAALLSARLWAAGWKTVVKTEERLLSALPKKEEKNVLVIGGAGYIGSALLGKLLDAGYKVRVLDLLLFGVEPIQHLLDHPNLELIEGDFRHLDTVVDAVRGMDVVVHLGAIVGDPACALNELLTIEINLSATRMIAEVAKGSGVGRFVFASTCSVYGTGSEILDEQSQLNPVSLYACTKMASEWVLNGMSGPNFAPTILRFGTIYGFSGRTRFDLVINLLTAKGFVESQITVFGGDQWRPFVHVEDAANAILKVLAAPPDRVRGQTFNVGSNEQNYTIQKAAELIHGLIPTALLVNKGNDTDLRNYRVSFDKIRSVLSFEPQWTVERGVQQVLSALQSGQITDYRDARYSNVKFLKEDGHWRLAPLGSNQAKEVHAYSPTYSWHRPEQHKHGSYADSQAVPGRMPKVAAERATNLQALVSRAPSSRSQRNKSMM